MPSQFNLPTVQHALLLPQAPARPPAAAAAAADNTHTPSLAWRGVRTQGMHLSSLRAPQHAHATAARLQLRPASGSISGLALVRTNVPLPPHRTGREGPPRAAAAATLLLLPLPPAWTLHARVGLPACLPRLARTLRFVARPPAPRPRHARPCRPRRACDVLPCPAARTPLQCNASKPAAVCGGTFCTHAQAQLVGV